jgi:prepilin-type N-terminal cleavage/methylation domain-containing protein
MKEQKGLILIELIMVIVIIGIIATFTGFLLFTGFKGYLTAKRNADGALNAQRALDRISLELRDLDYYSSLVANTSLTYKNEVLTGTRVLQYVSDSDTIQIRVNNVNYNLLENVSSFSLSQTPRDLNNDGVNEVAYFDVGFRIGFEENEIPRNFNAKIFPRHMVEYK